MESIEGAINLAKENGFLGAVFLGAVGVFFALHKRLILTPAMADLQVENAELKSENSLLRNLLKVNNIKWDSMA